MWHRAVSSLLTLQLHESQVRRFSGQLPIVVVGTPTDAIRFCWHLRSCRFKDVSWCAYSDQAGWFHDHPDFLVKLRMCFDAYAAIFIFSCLDGLGALCAPIGFGVALSSAVAKFFHFITDGFVG